MHPFCTSHSLHTCARIVRAWLLLALLIAPSLGRMHALLHDVGLGGNSHTTYSSHALTALLDEHPSAADCLLFDHLTLADTAPSVAWGAAERFTPAVPCIPPLLAIIPQRRAAFDARAPPA